MLPRKTDEVDHVYAMVQVGTEALARNWSPVLQGAGIALRVTGVFCHQTPKAHYTHPDPKFGASSPELADLLIVHEHQGRNRASGKPMTTRRAVLVQAKMVSQGVPNSGKVDAVQEYLYQQWPDFQLRGRGPQRRTFATGYRTLGPYLNTGCYGLIEAATHAAPMPTLPPFCCAFPWTFVRPRGPIRTAGGEDAGAFITSMLYDTSLIHGRKARSPTYPLALQRGRSSFNNRRRVNNHFDVTVEELLTLTAQKTVHFKHRAHLRGPRGHPFCLCLQFSAGPQALQSDLGNRFAATGDALLPPTGETPEDDFGDGISTLLIETASAD